MLTFLWRRITALLSTAVLLALLLALFLAYRILSFGPQQDDTQHLAAKQDYLQQLQATTLPANAPNILFILYDDMGYGDIGVGAGDSDMIDLMRAQRSQKRRQYVFGVFFRPVAAPVDISRDPLIGQLQQRGVGQGCQVRV